MLNSCWARYINGSILEGKNFNNKCDLWSIGVIIYQLLFNEFPYNSQTEYALLNNIKNLGLRNSKKSEEYI